MKNSILLITFILFFNFCKASTSSEYQSFSKDSIPAKSKPNQKSEILYCSDFAKTKYKLSIDGTKIKITRLYKEFVGSYTGTIKNGKIYSNNPDEKNQKELHGKYYKIEGKNFGVLNIENGDYEWFTECKR